MNNWTPKKRIIEIAAIVALFGAILYFSGLFMVIGKINSIENFYKDVESESSKEEKFWTIKSIVEANKEYIQTLRDFFVQKGDEVKFIEQIEETAKTAVVAFDIVSIDVKPDQKDLFKENVIVKMNIEGPWKNIMLFLDKLEKMPFGVSIENINLDAKAAGDWSGFIEFVVFKEK